jgi:uncharacterized alpha-E superfamily protein
MSLVTEQGLRARAERDAATAELSLRVLEYITDQPKRPDEIVAAFTDHRHDASMVRDAMWVLLNKCRAAITVDRRLTRIA